MERRNSANQWDWPLQHQDQMVKVENTRDHFAVSLDNPIFRPNEVEVGTVENELIITCQQDHAGFNRQLNRAYVLPADVDKSTLKWDVRGDGVLAISAQKKRK